MKIFSVKLTKGRLHEEVPPGKIGWWCAARFFSKTLTLFMSKTCDIPYPIYDLTENSKPCLRPAL